MFIDEAEIVFKGGHGGPGKVSFYNRTKGGPDGGNGGRGGDVYIIGTSDLMALRNFTVKKEIAAENGAMGESNRKFGKDGSDTEIRLPIGCLLEDLNTGEKFEITKPDQRILIAPGGLGGRGNYEFRSSRNTTPMYAQPGLPGLERYVKVNLSLIADFGLIGLPNAGKSSLLNELTRANAKVANYPFTTLEPNLGVLNKHILADIPGLIEGASEGKGLGIKFLKHIEKTSTLLHCISSETTDLKADYQLIRSELKKYNPNLLEKPEIIVITKTDLIDDKSLKELVKQAKKLAKNKLVITVSIHDWDALKQLTEALAN